MRRQCIDEPALKSVHDIPMCLRYLLLIAVTTVLPVMMMANAQSANPVFQPKIKPEIRLEPTSSQVIIDGELTEESWLSASRVDGFSEIQPREMAEPPVETEVLVTYDDNHLYLAFRAHDDPSSIRASFRNRDEIWQDDWVGLSLDTYGNAAQGHLILANPLGVQGDILQANGSEDVGFDIIYASAGKITADGYQVEMAIPFSSLRFPDKEEQEWRVTFLRNHPRDSRRLYSWAAMTSNNPCFLCQNGTIYGIRNIKAATKAELLPSIVGFQSGGLRDGSNPDSPFDNNRFRPEASLNLKYNLSSSIVAEATVNPDFSQIESDAAQIDVNSTVALFYPERRPFFQEGSDLFDTFMNVVYTRSINDPIGAGKMTARVGQTSVAVVSAVDEHTPLLLPFEERSEIVEGGRSVSNIVRVRQTFDENTYLGGTLTDRRLIDGGSGSLASADFRTQFWGNYVFEAQAALSHTQEANDSELSDQVDDVTFSGGRTAAFDGEQFAGHGLHLEFMRRARHWNFEVGYRSASPTFRAANGFVTTNAYRTVQMEQSYDFYPESGFVDRLTPEIEVSRGYNFAGEHKMDMIRPSLMGMLTGQTFFLLQYTAKRERFRDTYFNGLRSWTAGLDSKFSNLVGVGLFVSGGREIARFQQVPELGRQFGVRARLQIKPTQRLVISPSFNYASLHDLDSGERFYSGYILRTQTNYQFTRELSARVIVQYNDFSGRLDVEPLVSYKLNPFSIFYVGSTHDFLEFDGPGGMLQTDRQFFFKFQYLFRV